MGTVDVLTFAVTGMHCASCGILVDEAVEELAGVEQSQTDSRRGVTIVRADLSATSVRAIEAVIAALGYVVTPENR